MITFLVGFSSCNHWETVTSSGISTSFSSYTSNFKGFNEVVASSIMIESTQCQEKLKENKPIEILELKEGLIHLFWDIILRTSGDNLHDDEKPI